MSDAHTQEAKMPKVLPKPNSDFYQTIGMPGMNGIALKALLLQRYPDLPVILITGNQELAQLRELKEREPPYFFEKPFDGKTLVAAIRQVCGKTNKGTAD